MSPDKALVHAIEVNERHGAGIYLQRLFPESGDFVVFRSRTLYGGEQAFGSREVFLGDRFGTMSQLRRRIGDEGAAIRKILCVPYYPEDFRCAATLQEATEAPMCTYVMDDQNVIEPRVSDQLVRRCLEQSRLRLAISAEMADAYSKKYSLPFYWLPPVVRSLNLSATDAAGERGTFALLGNFWSTRQLDRFRAMSREVEMQFNWFGRGPEASWLEGGVAALERDGIVVRGFVPEDLLVTGVRQCVAAVIPTGELDADDDKMAFTKLSLPSRLVWIMTQAGIPVIVVGSHESAAARFVRAMGIGEVSGYDKAEFSQAVQRVEASRAELVARIREVAPLMVLPEGGEWIWASLAKGRPLDDRFERLRGPGEAATPSDEPKVHGPALSDRRRWGRLFRRLPRTIDRLYSRVPDLAWIRARRVPIQAVGPHTFSVGAFQRALASAMIRHYIQRGATILLRNGTESDLRPILNDYSIVKPARNCPAVPKGMVSFEGEDSLSREDLAALAGPGTLHLHFWTGFVHPGHLEIPAAGRRLLADFAEIDELFERIIDDPKFLFMSPKAIETHWPGVDAEAIGRPFAVSICWKENDR